jgi:sugar lactone lactonase YvrE
MNRKLKIKDNCASRNIVLFVSLSVILLVECLTDVGCKKNDMEELSSRGGVMVTTVAGDGTPGFKDGPAISARFSMPLDVAVHEDGTIYVADAFNGRIRKISRGMVSTFAGNGSKNTMNGNGTRAGFITPARIAVDKSGNVYTLDVNDTRVRMITSSANVLTVAGTGKSGFKDGPNVSAQFGTSFGLDVDKHGNIYVSDSENRRVRKISGHVNTIAGSGASGYADGDRSAAQFACPSGIVVDKSGNVFVADFSRVRKIHEEGVVSTYAGSDAQGYADGEASMARFTKIEDMVMDKQGNIFLSDDNRIRKISSEGMVSTVAGSTAGCTDGDAASAKFNSPQGLGIDNQGSVYVADFLNNRIRKITFH